MVHSAHDEKMTDLQEEASQVKLSERRDQLNRMLEDRAISEQKEIERAESKNSGYGQAMKMSSDFIAGIVVGGGIGWLVDKWFGTMPFGLVVFLLLGFAAGVLNILRSIGYVADPEDKLRQQKADEDSSS